MKLTKFMIAGAGAALMMTSAPAAFAAGTQAGTTVTNSVDLSYTSQGSSHELSGVAEAEFTVDHRISYTVTNEDGGEGNVDVADDAATEFTIASDSNKDFDADLSVETTGFEGDDSYTLLVDENGDGNFTAYSDAVTVPEDGEIKVRIEVDLDAGTADGAQRSVALKATPSTNYDESTNFSDITAEHIIHLIDPDADSGTMTFTVDAPVLTATKDVIVYSQDGDGCGSFGSGPDAGAAIPGACVQYTITVTNGGSAAARDVTITDDLSGLPLTYVGSDGGDDFGAGSLDGGILTATASGNITNGQSASFVFHATIDN